MEFGIQFAEEFEIVKPDLAIYLDVHPKTALSRKEVEEGKEGQQGKDMFEDDLEKQIALQEAFNHLANENIWCKWSLIDGNGSIQEVRDSIFTDIIKLMGW